MSRLPGLFVLHGASTFALGHGQDEAWVAEFAAGVREAVEQGDSARLLRTPDDAPDAHRARPTPQHFWPLRVAAGAAGAAKPRR